MRRVLLQAARGEAISRRFGRGPRAWSSEASGRAKRMFSRILLEQIIRSESRGPVRAGHGTRHSQTEVPSEGWITLGRTLRGDMAIVRIRLASLILFQFRRVVVLR
jgi:hypothetical protein